MHDRQLLRAITFSIGQLTSKHFILKYDIGIQNFMCPKCNYLKDLTCKLYESVNYFM